MIGKLSTLFMPVIRIGGWLLSLLLLWVQVGCSDDPNNPFPDVPDTLVRNYECVLAPVTKTALSSEGNVSWSAGDWIWYYSKDGGLLRMYTVEEDAAKINLPLSLEANAEYVTAVYGSASITNYSCDALTLGNIITAEQSGTFKNSHAAVARTTNVENTSLRFYNIVSFVCFSTNLADIDYVVFSANDDTPLHANGTVTVQYNNGIPFASFGASCGNSIKVNNHGPGRFFIATLPTTLQNGFTISCYDVNGKLIGTAVGHNPLTLKRSGITQLGIIDGRLVDENGIKLIDYGDDANWDGNGTSAGDIGQGGYGGDTNWDSDTGSNGNIGLGGFDDDYNWDSNTGSQGDVNKGNYGDDSDWDTSHSSGGDIGLGGYDGDSNWG